MTGAASVPGTARCLILRPCLLITVRRFGKRLYLRYPAQIAATLLLPLFRTGRLGGQMPIGIIVVCLGIWNHHVPPSAANGAMAAPDSILHTCRVLFHRIAQTVQFDRTLLSACANQPVSVLVMIVFTVHVIGFRDDGYLGLSVTPRAMPGLGPYLSAGGKVINPKFRSVIMSKRIHVTRFISITASAISLFPAHQRAGGCRDRSPRTKWMRRHGDASTVDLALTPTATSRLPARLRTGSRNFNRPSQRIVMPFFGQFFGSIYLASRGGTVSAKHSFLSTRGFNSLHLALRIE